MNDGVFGDGVRLQTRVETDLSEVPRIAAPVGREQLGELLDASVHEAVREGEGTWEELSRWRRQAQKIPTSVAPLVGRQQKIGRKRNVNADGIRGCD